MHRTPGRPQRSPGFSPGRRASPRGWGPQGPQGGRFGGSPCYSSPGYPGPPCFSPPGLHGPGFGSGVSRGRRWDQEPRRGGSGAWSQEDTPVEKYFSPNMIQDPWKNLSPVSKDQLQTGSRPGLKTSSRPGLKTSSGPGPDRD